MSWSSLCLLALLGVAQPSEPAQGDESVTAEQQQRDEEQLQVRRLVRQLDSTSVTQRQQAEDELIQLGAVTIRHLADPGPRATAEARLRVTRILTEIYRRQAEHFIQGSKITLQGAHSLEQAIAELEEQSGNAVMDYRASFGQPADDVEVQLALERVPFWQALDQVLDEAELTLYPYSGEEALTLIRRSPDDVSRRALATYEGAFRFVPKTIMAERDLQLQGARSLTLTMQASWEPRLRPISVRLPMNTVLVETSDGQPVDVAQPAAVLEYDGGSSQHTVNVQIPLIPPDHSPRELASVSGQLRVLVPGQVEQFRFAELDKDPRNVVQRKANATVVLESVRSANQDIWIIKIAVMFEKAGDALDSHRRWIFDNQAYLLTPDGQQIRPDGMETTRHNPQELGMAYVFDLPDGISGWEFVYETPVAVFDLPVEFELKDIPLP